MDCQDENKSSSFIGGNPNKIQKEKEIEKKQNETSNDNTTQNKKFARNLSIALDDGRSSFTLLRRKKLLIEKLPTIKDTSITSNNYIDTAHKSFWSQYMLLKEDYRFCFRFETYQAENAISLYDNYMSYSYGVRPFMELHFILLEEFLSIKKHKIISEKEKEKVINYLKS